MERERDMKVSILEWLFFSKSIASLHQQCMEYQQMAKKFNTVCRVVIDVDPFALLNHNAMLGHLILHTPKIVWKLVQEVCYTIIVVKKWITDLTSIDQLLVVLRLSTLPDLPEYTLSHIANFPSLTEEPRFFLISGVVCRVTVPERYTYVAYIGVPISSQSACFSCPNDHCVQRSRRCIRLHVAGASESDTIRNDFMCANCRRALVEDVSCRVLGNKVTISLLPVKALQIISSASQRHQAITVVIRDELCESVNMGAESTVIGIPMYELSEGMSQAQVKVTVEANNIFSVMPSPQSIPALPLHILEIHQACQYSPWSFAATMAYSFGAQVPLAPPGTYHRLKLAMLLSLVSNYIEDKAQSFGHEFVNIMAVGSDVSTLGQLLIYGGSFSPRCIVHSMGRDLCGTSRKDAASIFIDGGDFALAKGGTLIVSNFDCLKKDQKDKLHLSLETKMVTLSIPSNHTTEEMTQVSWPLQCSVWLCQSSLKSNKASINTEPDTFYPSSLKDKSSNIHTLAHRIALIMATDPPSSDAEDYLLNLLSDHLLDNAMEGEKEQPFTEDDFRMLLHVASNITPVISEEATKLIKAFYLASRHTRVSPLYGTEVPVAALDFMTAIAVAHCKLNLRAKVSAEDAVLAILLYEESLVTRLGYSVVYHKPSPHFRSDDISVYIGKELDMQMRNLQFRIEQFCFHQSAKSASMHEE